MNKHVKAFMLALSITFTAPAMAATENYGTLLSGSFTPAGTFATLSVSGSGTVYNFTLTALNLNTLFTNNAFIGAIAVDVDPSINPSSVTSVVGGSPVSIQNGGGPTGLFDFRFDLTGPQQNRLTANESVSWTATFASPVDFVGKEFALHVQGLTRQQGGSAFYVNTVTAIPEPESYAMMLAGLGLMGFVARLRRM